MQGELIASIVFAVSSFIFAMYEFYRYERDSEKTEKNQ